MSEETPQAKLETPDHTRVQVAAVVQAVIAVAVAFGVPISDEQSVALIALSGLLGTVLIAADAAIRRERARNADKLRPQAEPIAKETPAGTQADGEPTAPVDQLDDAELVEAIVELLRRILKARTPESDGQPVGDAPVRVARSRRRRAGMPAG